MLLHGDCLERLRELPACSVDACVTDPPYGLSFMGKKWDYDVPGEDIWRECLRVLKPGGHLLAFAGTRTQHRMAVRIEDAGFEIRDMIAWCYGSGFPKSLDVSKAIDKAAGAERAPGRTLVTDGTRGNTPNAPANATCADCGRPKWGKDYCQCPRDGGPATPEAQQWDGWGTALKPSIETVTWATKPTPAQGERDRIMANLWKLEARLWLLSSASAAAQNSTSSQSEFDAACATAQWTADDAINTRDALRGLMDTWQCEMATHMSLSIVSSWRRTLEESSKPGSTSTTETESKTTTDWKTLSCCLSEITPESIIQACSLPGGFNANASTAGQIFNASLASLQSTLTLSAIEPATWQELDARQGVGVKPSLDPVVMARKPFPGTVAANVLAHGTGGINVDGCRVGAEILPAQVRGVADPRWVTAVAGAITPERVDRWPANLIHDGSDEVVGLFPHCNGKIGMVGNTGGNNKIYGKFGRQEDRQPGATDSGSAARFFYCAKASKADRNEGNTHPTVKPTDLMRYLCRLVTPPGGIVLDPFMGSGSTGKAAMLDGFRFIGIEREAEYLEIAKQRMQQPAQTQGTLL
jgi:DNA modification methylase